MVVASYLLCGRLRRSSWCFQHHGLNSQLLNKHIGVNQTFFSISELNLQTMAVQIYRCLHPILTLIFITFFVHHVRNVIVPHLPEHALTMVILVVQVKCRRVRWRRIKSSSLNVHQIFYSTELKFYII